MKINKLNLYNMKINENDLYKLVRKYINEEISNKCPKNGCVKKKPNGKWGVISGKTGKFWNADYDSKKDAEAGLQAYFAKNESIKKIKNIIDEEVKKIHENVNGASNVERLLKKLVQATNDDLLDEPDEYGMKYNPLTNFLALHDYKINLQDLDRIEHFLTNYDIITSNGEGTIQPQYSNNEIAAKILIKIRKELSNNNLHEGIEDYSDEDEYIKSPEYAIESIINGNISQFISLCQEHRDMEDTKWRDNLIELAKETGNLEDVAKYLF